jgi:hypothetical protein
MTGRSWGRRASLGLQGVSITSYVMAGQGSSHGGQMALLQHRSLYESMASWPSSAQKKFFGKTVVGRVLRMSALCRRGAFGWYAQCKLLQVVGKRRRLGVCCGVGHGELRRMRGW